MALPIEVGYWTSDATDRPNASWGNIGPFEYAGRIFTFGMFSNSFRVWAAWKQTLPSDDSFGYLDGFLLASAPIQHYSVAQDGQYLHIYVIGLDFTSGTDAVMGYARFDCKACRFVDASNYSVGSGDYYQFYTHTDHPTTYWGDIAVRSDGDVIIIHPGENPTSMGGNYQICSYSRLEGTSTWNTNTTVASSGTKDDNYLYGSVVMGSSDQCHFGYIRSNSGGTNDLDFHLRALNSSNTLRTERTHAGTFSRVNKGINYTRSSTETIAFQVSNSGTLDKIYFSHFTDDTSPTFTEETITSSSNSTHDGWAAGFCFDPYATSQDNYSVYIDSTDSDLYLMGDDGGTTWSDQNSSTAIVASITGISISANIITREGQVKVGVVYENSATGRVDYNEFDLNSGGNQVSTWNSYAGSLPETASDRALFVGGLVVTSEQNTIDYITMSTRGNATDFGDLSAALVTDATGSTTRAIAMGGENLSGTVINEIQYVTIATTGNTSDFGDLLEAKENGAAHASNTRSLYAGGANSTPTRLNVVEYVTTATTGNGTDFGDLNNAADGVGGCGSPTRMLVAGGFTTANINVIDYLDIATLGNATDFGDLLGGRSFLNGMSSNERAIFIGGGSSGIMQYCTIATTGNTALWGYPAFCEGNYAGTGRASKGFVAGGEVTDSSIVVDRIEELVWNTLGWCIDFGDLTVARDYFTGTSSQHGGLIASSFEEPVEGLATWTVGTAAATTSWDGVTITGGSKSLPPTAFRRAPRFFMGRTF